MKRRSITLPDDLDDTIDDIRNSRVSRSEWLQDAARVRLLLKQRGEFDGLLNELNASGSKGNPTDESTEDSVEN